MKAGLNKIKIAIISMIVLAMAIGQLELFGKVYAEELEKIKEQDPYGEYYDENINNVHKTSAQIIEKGNPDVITKEPSVDEEDTSRQNDQEIIKLRTENTKTYKLSSGEYVTDFYFEQIHKKEDGKYVEIDNDIEKKTSLFRSTPSYENKDGLYDVNIQKGVLEITDPKDNVLTVMPSGSLTNYAIKENVILYSEVEKNLDLEYRINSNTVSQNIYINGELDKDTYSFEVYKDDYNVSKNDAGSIVFKKDKKEVFVLNAPYLVDKDGNRNQEVGYDYKELDNGNIKVTLSLTTSWLSEEDRVYPVVARSNVAVENVDVIDLESSYIRSGRPNIQSQYSDLFVGYDDNFYGGKNSNIKIARTFIYFAMPNIGENQRVENAVLKLYKEQDLDRANELNDINIYNSSYVDPGKVTWNTQPADNQKQFISNTKFSKPKGFKEFDITKHVQELKDGQKKTLILQVTDESPNWKCNVFNSESTGNLPKVEIYHCDDFDVDPNLDINEFDNELRVYSKDGQYFEAISMDGIAKPNSDIDFDLYAKTNETDFELVKSQQAKEKSSPYFIDPVYITDPIDGTQKYEKGEVNYTTSYLKIGDIPKYDTFYEYRMKVKKDGTESEKELITDGFIIYKVKLGDNLKSIASHYGLKVDDIKKDNNTSTNKVKEGDVLFLRFAKDNPKVPKDVYRPPLKLSSFEAKYVYRGPACYGNCAVADPVNTSIGNFYHESKDFTLTDFDELSLTRVYNSYGEDNASIFGNNYSSNIEQYISYDKDDNMIFYRGDGKILKIEKKDGKYVPKLIDRLTVNVDGDYVSIKDDKEDVTYIFDEYGILTSIKTKTGFESRINYDEYGFITNIDMGNKQVTFEYNDYHLVSKINLPNGTNVQYQYNADRQLTVFIDANGNSEQYSYDKNGKVKSITDKNGNTLAQNTYKDNGVVVSQTDALGNSSQTHYNAFGLVEKEVDKRGFAVSYVYNDKFQLTEMTDKLGNKATFEYNDQGFVSKATNQNGFVSEYEYDIYGQKTKETDPNKNVTENEYDLIGQVVKTVEPRKTTVNKYDSLGRLVSVKENDKTTKENEYNDLNQIVKSTNALKYVSTYEYDKYGNKTKETYEEHETVNKYDVNSQLIKKTENKDKVTTYSYDALGREVSQKQNDKEIISKKYDAVSNVVEKTEKGLTTQYCYDALKHPVQYLYPSLEDGSMKAIVSVDYDEEGNAVQYKDIYDHVIKREYDANSNMIAETNSNGFITRYQYDSLNNMTKVQSPLERVMKYDYDGNNNLVERSYNDQKATYEYDEADNLIKEVSEYGLTETYQYDDFGQMTSYTKNDGTTIDYSYDALGRKLSEGTRQFKYDAYDNLLEADYNNKSVKYTYDKFNNITKVKDANDNNVEYKWDIYGNRTEIKYNDYTIGYTYSQFDKIDKVSKNGKEYASYSYDVRGNTKSLERNGITTDYSYDELNRRTAYVNTKGDKMLSEYKYEYDGQDNVISETINGVVNSYDYNESDELKASTKTIDGKTVITEYSYDLFGNKVESSSDGTNKIYRYNDKNQLTSIKSKDGLTDIYYDKNGNVRDIYYAGGYKEYYQYDEFGQLTALKTNRDRTYNYEYDGEGDRIHEEKIINSPYDLDYKQDTEEWFDYMQSLPFTEVEELLDAKKSDESFDAMRYQLTYRRKNGLCASNLIKDPKSNEKCEYKDYLLDKTAENTLVLSENDDVHIYGEERISTESADGTQTYLSGNNQSVMAEISSKGTMSQIEYDDFGKTDDKTSGYGYDGEKLDTTGNIYLRARYYNPRIGQFVQIDDYKGTQDNITSQNRYTYCLNNQYKYVDPSGHFGITTMVVLGILSYTGIGLLGIGLAANEKRKREEKEKAIKVANKNSKKKKKDDNNHNLNPTPSKGKGATSSVTNGIKKTVSETRKIVNKTVKQTAKTIQKKIPEPCPNDKVVSDSIEKYCNKLKKDYYGKYKDKGTQKAISSTIEQLRNEAYKENKVSWIKNKYEEYRDRIKIPPYKSDIGVSYLGGRYISLNGSKTSDAFVSKFNDFGNGYTFTMNTTEFVGKGSIKTITVVEFGAQLPSIDLKTGSFDHKIKCQLVFYEITYSIMVNSFTKLDLEIVTGIGIEFGWSYDSVENVFEIVNIADLGIGLLFRINIFINKLLAC